MRERHWRRKKMKHKRTKFFWEALKEYQAQFKKKQ